MERRSKELLHLEHKNTSFSSLESSLSFCKIDSSFVTKKRPSDGTPLTAPVAPSHLLGKVKDFLGVMSEANQRLQLDAKNYDIEELTGNESEVIEMDLMLGVADLHTPEAVAAAESAISGSPPVIPLGAATSETGSDEDSSDDEEEEEEEEEDERSHGEDRNGSEKDGSKTCSIGERPISAEDKIISQQKRNQHSRKRPKIFELS